MTKTATVSPYADAAALLSAWWSRPVAEQVEMWTQTWPYAHALAEDNQSALGRVAALSSTVAGAAPEVLLDEYEWLFVGPGWTPCPPYESLWLSDQPKLEQGRLMGQAASDVAGLYRELGLSVASATGELPDHIAIELEALAVALHRDDPDAERVAIALLHDHLNVWVPNFCRTLLDETGNAFYLELAEMTQDWVAAAAAHIEHAAISPPAR